MKTIFAASALQNHCTTATRPALLIGALIAGLAVTAPGYADDDPELDNKEQREAPTAFAANEPKPVLNWGEGNGKSYFVPIYEIVGFEFALNRFNHYFIDDEVYASPSANLRKNLHGRWVVDNDKFSTNQFLHPYQGAVYQGLARSAGLGFWESFACPMVGGLLWEEAGEGASPAVSEQGAGGYGGGGVNHGSGAAEAGPAGDGQRDYHNGITPQQLVALRLIFGDRGSLDTTVRDYYISHVAATESTGTENIVRAEVTLPMRVYNLHGIMLRYAESHRAGNYAGLPHSHQSVGVVSVGYALLGQTRFGAVDWRPHSAGGP